MNTRQALLASLAAAPRTIESIAIDTQRAVERDKRLRKVSRYARDAALFADQGKEADAKRALEKSARALLELEGAE